MDRHVLIRFIACAVAFLSSGLLWAHQTFSSENMVATSSLAAVAAASQPWQGGSDGPLTPLSPIHVDETPPTQPAQPSAPTTTPHQTRPDVTTAAPPPATTTPKLPPPPPPPTPLPYLTTTFGNEWVGDWGTSTLSQAGLTLSATTQTTGAESVLSGSTGWQNYMFTISAGTPSDSEIALIARRSDDKNYVSCNFGGRTATLSKTVGGTQTKIASGSYTPTIPPHTATYGISVEGVTVRCYENGLPLMGGTVTDPVLQTGGIAIDTWNPSRGNAELVVSGAMANLPE